MKKRMTMVLVALGAVATAAILMAGGASALAGSDFEGADGNLVVNTAGNHDWVNAPNLTVGVDLPTGTGDNSFGQGTKEDNVNVTVVNGSIPNSKADLARFAIAGESVGGDNFLYLAWSRENQSGTVNFDFEINRQAQPDLTTPGPKLLVRTQGDLLINYAFAGGSNTPTLTARTWNGTKWGSAASLSGCSEGATNSATVSENLGGNTAVDRPAQQFGEAAINLTDCGITPAGSCEGFSSAYVKSRSSTSFTSEIKDFIAPVSVSFSNCGAILVSKTAKHAADGPGDHPQAGVNFTIGSTTQATGTDGTTCFSGLALGQSYTVTETVPTGYVSDDSSQDVSVTSAGTCASGAATVSFHNTPLTNVEIKIHSQIDGGTLNSVDCDNDALDTSAAAGDVDVTANDQSPQTITCTITIDP